MRDFVANSDNLQNTEIMEKKYQAYTREINGRIFYFVKNYSIYPEFEDVPEILESMGMHSDFFKACTIAKVEDEQVIDRLMAQVNIVPETARVIPFQRVKVMTNSLLRNTHHALMKLKLASIN